MITKLEEISNILTKECPICLEDYDSKSKKPMVMECGHSICYNCLSSILRTSKKCPFDKRELTNLLQNYPINWTFLEILNSFKKIHKPVTEYNNYKKMELEDGIYEGQVERYVKNHQSYFSKNGYGIMKYLDGSVYTGNWAKNKKSGYGRHVQRDLSEYEGEWANDLPNGKGKFIFKSGEINSYEGSWRNGKFFGSGKIVYSDGMELETIFLDGVPVSDIVNLRDQEGNRVVGISEQNLFKGKTYQITKNNDIFIGTLRPKSEEDSAEMFNRIHVSNYIRHGYGVLHFAEGGVFEGNFENNQIHGEGKYIYKDGSIYQGQLKNGLKNEKGQLTFPNGDCYEGEWNSDKKHGKGIFKYANGDVYTGEFSFDKKSGNGKFVKLSGYAYDGTWKDDLMHGQGLETLETQESYHGEFVNGIRNGKGLLVYPNGDIYKGEFKDNKMHGYGLLVSYKGDEINGKWSNGMLVSEKGPNKDKNCIVF